MDKYSDILKPLSALKQKKAVLLALPVAALALAAAVAGWPFDLFSKSQAQSVDSPSQVTSFQGQQNQALQTQPPAQVMPSWSVSSPAENRLFEVYRLLGQSQFSEALAAAEKLTQDFPNFSLAQLTYADLLTAQNRPVRSVGDVPQAMAKAGGDRIGELRAEALLRLKAYFERPNRGTVPSQVIKLSQRHRHVIAVDASRARLYLFENSSEGLRIIADYYVSVGKLGVDKAAEGDGRTPLGVYFVAKSIERKSLTDFYGSGALPINYPNPYDIRRGKTGSGIWLHGTPSDRFSRAPLASDGCVVMANPDLLKVIGQVEVKNTPVILTRQLDWQPPEKLNADTKSFTDTLQAWRAAKSTGSAPEVLAYYTSDFTSNNGQRISDWTSTTLRNELAASKGQDVQLRDLSYFHWNDTTEIMVVTFDEAYGNKVNPTTRQYWIKQNGQWKIFFEGNIK